MFTSEQLSDYVRSIIHWKSAALARAQDDDARQKINEGARRFLAPLEIEPPAQWDGRLNLRGLRLPSLPDDAMKLLPALGIAELDVSENDIRRLYVPFSLKKLSASECINLKFLDAHDGFKLEELDLAGAGVSEIFLPRHIVLKKLYLSQCPNLKKLDATFYGLLEELDIAGSAIETLTLPDGHENFKKCLASHCPNLKTVNAYACDELEELDIDGSPIETLTLPNSPHFKKWSTSQCPTLKTLDAFWCNALEELDLAGSAVETLSLPNSPYFKKWSASQCPNLKRLRIGSTLEELELVDSEIETVELSEFNVLKKLYVRRCPNLKTLDAGKCKTLRELDIAESAIESLVLPANGNFKKWSFSLQCPSLKILDASKSETLDNLDIADSAIETLILPPSLKKWSASQCPPTLKTLNASHCRDLNELDLVGSAVETLTLPDSPHFKKLSSVQWPTVKTLDAYHCGHLEELSIVDSAIETLGLPVHHERRFKKLSVSRSPNLKTLNAGRTSLNELDIAESVIETLTLPRRIHDSQKWAASPNLTLKTVNVSDYNELEELNLRNVLHLASVDLNSYRISLNSESSSSEEELYVHPVSRVAGKHIKRLVLPLSFPSKNLKRISKRTSIQKRPPKIAAFEAQYPDPADLLALILRSVPGESEPNERVRYLFNNSAALQEYVNDHFGVSPSKTIAKQFTKAMQQFGGGEDVALDGSPPLTPAGEHDLRACMVLSDDKEFKRAAQARLEDNPNLFEAMAEDLSKKASPDKKVAEDIAKRIIKCYDDPKETKLDLANMSTQPWPVNKLFDHLPHLKSLTLDGHDLSDVTAPENPGIAPQPLYLEGIGALKNLRELSLKKCHLSEAPNLTALPPETEIHMQDNFFPQPVLDVLQAAEAAGRNIKFDDREMQIKRFLKFKERKGTLDQWLAMAPDREKAAYEGNRKDSFLCAAAHKNESLRSSKDSKAPQ